MSSFFAHVGVGVRAILLQSFTPRKHWGLSCFSSALGLSHTLFHQLLHV
jgi:hypothetical protein